MKILTTGPGRGGRKPIVAELFKMGHKVAGAICDPEQRIADAAGVLRGFGAEIADLDAMGDASVDAGVAAARKRPGSIDVLITNARVGNHGRQEDFSAADFQRLFDVNLFGPQCPMHTVSPEMRAPRRGSHPEVDRSSGPGRAPYHGSDNAMKWALVAMSENFKAELSRFGVDVAIVEPGGFPTEFHGNPLLPTSTNRNARYGDISDAPEAARQQTSDFLATNPRRNPSLVAESVVAVAVAVVEAAPCAGPCCTEVNKVGTGGLVEPMNDLAGINTAALFEDFGMADLLKLKVDTKETS